MQQPTPTAEAPPYLDLQSAFSSSELPPEPAIDPTVDERLLQLVPTPRPLDFDRLEHEVLSQRRIFIHEPAGIPIAAVISVGGALLFHAALLGLLFLGYLYMPRISTSGGGGPGNPDFGGTTSTSLVLDDLGGTHVIPTDVVPAPAAQTPTPVPAAAPPAPPAPRPTPPAPNPVPPAPPQLASAVTVPPPVDPVIGLSPNRDPIPPKPLAITPPPQVTGLPIAAPPHNPILASPVTPGPPGPVPALAHGRPGPARPGVDDPDDDNDDEVIDLTANGSGTGTGSGKHHGSGIDRGASGANNETPQVLDAPAFKLWADYLYHPPAKRVILTVTVLPDGAAGAIEIAQSCGIPEIDRAYKNHVALHYRFRPAYRDGRPFATTIQCSQSFGTDDE